ncbi:MAG: creatininase family protein [Pseudomonadota bacterium]
MVEVEWARLKAHELRALAEKDAVVILPVASIEQHGPHLPVMTDTRIGQEVACRAARKAYDQRPTIVTPVVWQGLSEHHMPFGGTLTLDHDTFFAVMRCLVQSVQRHGFQNVLISNSHGGNIIAMQTAAERLAMETGTTIVATTYVAEAGDEITKLLRNQPRIMHACEGETAMMLALTPELVDTSELDAIAVERGPGVLSAGKASFRWRSFTHGTGNGVSGDPANADAQQGEALLEAASQAVADLITDADVWAPMQDLRSGDTKGIAFRDSKN